ncbi:MAG: deoxyribodipyrimidine photo-lyase [Alphaproteobacteria bacterium]|nr:deoxyribodipyrimidine photo-lyase [Alphaproteobacteria bacterium]
MPSSAPRAHRSPFLSIAWLRRDLRLADNPALAAAARRGAVLPLYILDDGDGLGGAQRWWLHHSLAALERDLGRLGSLLVLRSGPAARIIADVMGASGADAVFWNECHDAPSIARDAGIEAGLAARGAWPRSESLSDWRLLPTAPGWAGGLRATWAPGEANARARLEQFVDQGLAAYAASRDRPDIAGTSMLSPHLAFGEIGPRQVWHAVAAAGARDPRHAKGAEAFLRELGWREVSRHLLQHHPDLAHRPLRAAFETFPWRDDAGTLAAWRALPRRAA